MEHGSYRKNDIVTVTIEDIGNDGEGIGKSEGYTLFVKDAVIGDTVEARITKCKKNYGYARVEKVVTPSSFRVEPRCRFHRQCGGCQIQAMSYERQLAYKQDKVRNHLIRIGGFPEEKVDAVIEPVIGMENPWHYRNKAQYPVGYDRNGKLVTGFYAGRTHDIIANTDCALGIPENKVILEAVLEYMRENKVTAYRETEGTGLVRHVLIRTGFATGEIMVCIVINGKKLPEEGELVRKLTGLSFAQKDNEGTLRCDTQDQMISKDEKVYRFESKSCEVPESPSGQEPGLKRDIYEYGNGTKGRLFCQRIESISVSINTEKTNVIMGKEIRMLWGKDRIRDNLGGISFAISPLSFYQVNPIQTEKLYSLALDYAGLTGKETVWDLYCGIGTISLFMAKKAKQVCGVEMIPEAIEDARTNAQDNQIENAQFYVGKAEDVLPAFYEGAIGNRMTDADEQMRHPDVIVVDPPRKGCDEKCLETMIAMRPERIVYVSCDSATLARDLKVLCAGGYELEKVRAVDQFGHSVHVETVCLLSNRKSKPDTHVKLSLSMEDYYRIKEEGKNNQ